MSATEAQTIENSQERIFSILFNEDEITWQSIIYELIKTEQMNPWDVDISLLTRKYIKTIKKLKKLDFRVSGKVLLAAAILLKIKSKRLLGKDLAMFDRYFIPEETNYIDEIETEDYIQDYVSEIRKASEDEPLILPKTPQPRDRKVSVFDLVKALEKALEVKKRRIVRSIPPRVELPEKNIDMSVVIKNIYKRIKHFFTTNKRLTFSQLVPSNKKEDIVYTFIPLLHLTNQQKVDLEQKVHFGEIEISLKDTKKEINQELGIKIHIPEDKYFYVKDGQVLKDKEDLIVCVNSLNNRTYKFHVNKDKNDFADWARGVLKEDKLARALERASSLEEAKFAVSKFM